MLCDLFLLVLVLLVTLVSEEGARLRLEFLLRKGTLLGDLFA